MPERRLFLALPIPQHVCNELADYTSALPLANVRWTALTNLHITLRFLGNIQESHLSELETILECTMRQHSVFSLKFKQISFVPQKNHFRMIWAEYYNSDPYQALFDATKNIISLWKKKYGYRMQDDDNTPLIPHVTLGRCKVACIFPDAPLPQPTIPDLIVDTVQLMESTPTPTGSAYTVLKTFLLQK